MVTILKCLECCATKSEQDLMPASKSNSDEGRGHKRWSALEKSPCLRSAPPQVAFQSPPETASAKFVARAFSFSLTHFRARFIVPLRANLFFTLSCRSLPLAREGRASAQLERSPLAVRLWGCPPYRSRIHHRWITEWVQRNRLRILDGVQRVFWIRRCLYVLVCTSLEAYPICLSNRLRRDILLLARPSSSRPSWRHTPSVWHLFFPG